MIEEVVTIVADGLRLEGRLAYDDAVAMPAAAVLICPPHPFLGGDMDNNVVTALTRGLADAGLPVLRFNYRGIGASACARDLQADQEAFWADSTCPAYESEMRRDSRAAFDHLQDLFPRSAALHVIGYSFGCLPAIEMSNEARLTRLGLISPPLAKWPLTASVPLRTLPRALFFAPGDFACPEALLDAFYAALPLPKELHRYPGADHFFVGHETALVAAARRFLLAA